MENRITASIFAVVAVLAFSTVVLAQSPARPGSEPAVIKDKPIPRTPDGKPDLSGFWAEWRRVGNLPEVGPQYLARQREIEGSLPRREQEPMALTPWAKERFLYNDDPIHPEDRVRNELDPSSHCFPSGTVRLSPPFEILQTPRKVWILYEEDHTIRQIFTDGRKLPEDLELTWYGYSVGRWDGDTLVVDTFGMREETLLDGAGHVHSTELRIAERIRRIAYDVLEIERTLTDPKALAKPYTRRTTYPLAPADWDMLEDIKCEQRYRKGIWFGEGPAGL